MSDFRINTKYGYEFMRPILPPMYMGLKIIESTLAVTYRQIPIEKNWVQKVIEWNPCNQRMPDFETIEEPTSYKAGDTLICHPAILVELRNVS